MRIPFSKIDLEEFKALKVLERLGFDIELLIKTKDQEQEQEVKQEQKPKQETKQKQEMKQEIKQEQPVTQVESFKPPKEKVELIKKQIMQEYNIENLVSKLDTLILGGRGKRKQVGFKPLLEWIHHNISLLKDTNYGVLACYKSSVIFWNYVFFLYRKNVQDAPNMAVYPTVQAPNRWLYRLIHNEEALEDFVYLEDPREFNRYIPVSKPLELVKINYTKLCELDKFLNDECNIPERVPEVSDKNKYVLKTFMKSLNEITSLSGAELYLSEDYSKYLVSTKDTILILASFR